MTRRVALVVPARDEEALLPRVLSAVPDWVAHVVPVDDGSRDETARVISNWKDRRCAPLRHDVALGVGGAILAGYRRALALGAETIAVAGGDAQMDLAELERVVAPISSGEADYVQGNRFDGGVPRGPMPGIRRLGNRWLSRTTSWAAGTAVGDSQCGFTAASAAFLRRLDLRRIPSGYGFPAYLRLEAHRLGARVVEVPVRALYGDEVSGIRPLRDPATICARLLWRGLRRRLGRVRSAGSPAPSLLGEGAGGRG